MIKLYKVCDEIKSYNNFDSIELNTILKDKILSSKYELEFHGDSTEIIKIIMRKITNFIINIPINLLDLKCM